MNKHTIEDINNLLDSANQLEAMEKKELEDSWSYCFVGVCLVSLMTLISAAYFCDRNTSDIISLVCFFLVMGTLITDFPQKYAEYRIKKNLKIPAMLQEIDSVFSDEKNQKFLLNHIIGKYNKYPQHLNIKDINNLQLLFINKQYKYARKMVAEIFTTIIQVENQQESIEDYNAKLNIDKIIGGEEEKEYEINNWKTLL